MNFDNPLPGVPLIESPFFAAAFERDGIDAETRRVARAAGRHVPERFVQFASQGDWTGFDPKQYLQANPDVAAAGVNPYEHFLMHGLNEKRRLRP
ncbi:MAG: hypothetical protein ACXU8N_14955 [Telluria sp.]